MALCRCVDHTWRGLATACFACPGTHIHRGLHTLRKEGATWSNMWLSFDLDSLLLQICVSVGQTCEIFRDKRQMARLCTHPHLMPDASTPATQALCHLTLLASPASFPLHNMPLSDQITSLPLRTSTGPHLYAPGIHSLGLNCRSVMFSKLPGYKTQLKSL